MKPVFPSRVLRTLSICLIFMLIGVFRLEARSPTTVANEYFDHLRNNRYEAAAGMFDPQSLQEFRSAFDFLFALPPEIANPVTRKLFGENATTDTVRKMSNRSFFAAVLKGLMDRVADSAVAINFDQLQIIGEIPEGADVMHVVSRTRVRAGSITIENMEVLSMKKSGNEWHLLMSGKIKGMAEALRQAFQQVPGSGS